MLQEPVVSDGRLSEQSGPFVAYCVSRIAYSLLGLPPAVLVLGLLNVVQYGKRNYFMVLLKLVTVTPGGFFVNISALHME